MNPVGDVDGYGKKGDADREGNDQCKIDDFPVARLQSSHLDSGLRAVLLTITERTSAVSREKLNVRFGGQAAAGPGSLRANPQLLIVAILL
jgi:hypothetical protein